MIIKTPNRLGTQSGAANICTKKLSCSFAERYRESERRVEASVKISADGKRTRKCLFELKRRQKNCVVVKPVERERGRVSVCECPKNMKKVLQEEVYERGRKSFRWRRKRWREQEERKQTDEFGVQ